jgi:hypothetical protein
MTINNIKATIETQKTRSAWTRGVKAYALELIEELEEAIERGYFDAEDLSSPSLLERQLLNGASSWDQYSWGGCSLIYNADIAARLCTPSELKKTGNGSRRPNASEEWLDTQARALYQASAAIVRASRGYSRVIF